MWDKALYPTVVWFFFIYSSIYKNLHYVKVYKAKEVHELSKYHNWLN